MRKLALLLAGVVAAVAAHGANISFAHPFSLGPGETLFGVQLSQFNAASHPATPVLKSVTVTLEVTFGGGMTFFNDSASTVAASGGLSSARVVATPLIAGLLAPDPVSLPLSGSTSVPGKGSASISPQSSSSSPPAVATDASTLVLYQGNGTVSYDIDFTALYPQRVTPSPAAITCILCNERVTGQITVTYEAESSAPTGVLLDALGASWAAPGVVVLNWHTSVESNVLGFHLDRQVGGNWVRVSAGMIPALGGGRPNSYRYQEAGVPQEDAVKYRLSQVGVRGELVVLRETTVQVGIRASVTMDASGLRVSVQGLAGGHVRVEVAPDVARGPWIPTVLVALDENGEGEAGLEVPAGDGAWFYRLRQE